MALKSAVELSEHRLKIDKLLKEGKSPRFISDWLKGLKTNPESISHTSINTYRKNKFNVKKEATRKYNEKKSKALLDEASDEIVNDLESLDDIIKEGKKVKLDIDNLRPDMETGVTDLDIENVKIRAKRLIHN